jgi:hypothetical protein
LLASQLEKINLKVRSASYLAAAKGLENKRHFTTTGDANPY